MRGGWVERGTVLIRLARPHFAFYRGYLDGLDAVVLAQRYLDLAGNDDRATGRRAIQVTVTWIREQLLVAARRTMPASSARLLAITPERLSVVYGANVPTLDAFREERDPYELFSEHELITLFQEEYGSGSASAARRAARNARLRSKQLAALWELEKSIDADPSLSDGVAGWFDSALARRLNEAGVHTLGQLVERIQGAGYRWYAKIPKVGEKAAAHIVRWLTQPSIESALGVTLHMRGLVRRQDLPDTVPPVNPRHTAIVPLERFLLPTELDGSQGENRGTRCQLSANDDLAAIDAWLTACRPGAHTRRSYRKEAERLLLWAILEKGKPLSSLTDADCADYRGFLRDLGRAAPAEWAQRFAIRQENWLGSRGMPRWSHRWRPFEGPLSAGSQKTALVVVRAMCQWLTDRHYLHGNPFKSVGRLAQAEGKIDVSRSLTIAEWQVVKTCLLALPPDDRAIRLRFILVLAYGTGLRLSELVALRRCDLNAFSRAGETGIRWELRVTGKAAVTRDVQLAPFVVDEIRNYFLRRGHASLEQAPADTPLIASLPSPTGGRTADAPLSAARLYDILKGFFSEVAATLGPEQHEMAERLRKSSTHWLRHTFATHALHSGMSLEVVRDLLGHKSLATTSAYVSTERDHRSREMERFGVSVLP
ncbi:MAG: integrase family protein [Noviherbaspirillum sp.]|nr:integrase family protein [Noviherbaspirillum sp.]